MNPVANTLWPESACCCRTCYEAYVEETSDQDEKLLRTLSQPFIVCNTCGNKRCPKATDHSLECTHSNEPGQKGSAYE